MSRRGSDIDLHERSAANGGPVRSSAAPPGMSVASPPADRPTRSRWRDPRLAAGLAVVALCAVLGARLVGGADDTVGIWAARGALQAGQPVTGADLARRQVRFEDQEDADRYVSADDELPAGARLDRPMGAGELLPRAALAAGGPAGLTEVPLAVRTEAVPPSVQVGSTVDVWVTSDPGAAAASGRRPVRSRLVFADVPVVSAPAVGSSLGPTTTRSVVVGVPTAYRRRLGTLLAAVAGGDTVLTARR